MLGEFSTATQASRHWNTCWSRARRPASTIMPPNVSTTMPRAVPSGEGGWRSPVRGAPITSKFNPQRMHLILKKKMPHDGTDFGAPTGTPIYAASYGKITKLGNYGANGNYIAIAHDNGYETGYSHCSRFEPGLKVGDQVKRSQVIGYVGSTGRSTGPHLHFSARKDGAYIDAENPSPRRADGLAERGARDLQRGEREIRRLLEAVALPPALPPQLIAAAPAASEGDTRIETRRDEDGDNAQAAAPRPPIPEAPAVALPHSGQSLRWHCGQKPWPVTPPSTRWCKLAVPQPAGGACFSSLTKSNT